MNQITCRKPCNIGGRRFSIGDTVPEGCIEKARINRLERMGLITIVEIPEAPEQKQTKPAAGTTARKRGGKA